MIIPKKAIWSTEFHLTLGGLAAASWLYVWGHVLPAALLAAACISSYNVSRGIMKAGFGHASHSRTGGRLL